MQFLHHHIKMCDLFRLHALRPLRSKEPTVQVPPLVRVCWCSRTAGQQARCIANDSSRAQDSLQRDRGVLL